MVLHLLRILNIKLSIAKLWSNKFAPYLYLCLLFTTLPFQTIFAQYTVHAKIDTNQIEFAGQITYTISTTYDTSYQVFFPQFSEITHLDSLHQIEIVNQHFSDSSAHGKIIKHQANYIFTAFDSGLYLLPDFPVIFAKKDGSKADTAFTNALSFQVIPFEIDTSLPINDIKPPLPLPFSIAEIQNELIFGVIVLLFFAALIYYFFNYRKKAKPIAPIPVVVRPSHEIAFEKLELLKAKNLWQKGEVKAFHSELSEIFREYLENRFNIIALEATTDEIISKMQIFSIDKKQKDILSDILTLSDLVKFAKGNPLPEEHENSFRKVFDFIQNTLYKVER